MHEKVLEPVKLEILGQIVTSIKLMVVFLLLPLLCSVAKLLLRLSDILRNCVLA